ncbi:hypothetical protein F4810DRAFT_712468 [Camillea tinctor]|nr:hypothetical protein F4810DRAFT_712468 [Camillea tinctor]
MHPIILTALFAFAAALPTASVSSQSSKTIVHSPREDNSLAEARSVVDIQLDAQPKRTLYIREVRFDQSYDYPESELLIHAYARAAFFWVTHKDDDTYSLYFQNLGPANGPSYKFDFTAPGNGEIVETLAGGGSLSPEYTIRNKGGQLRVVVSDP